MAQRLWTEVRARLEEMRHSPALRALDGEGPVYQAMLDERARLLAQPVSAGYRVSRHPVLCLAGESVHWALEVTAVRRVDPLGPCTPVPGLARPVMGLTTMADERYLAVDLDALAADAAPRPLDRPGHAVALRGGKVALVVERAVGLRRLELLPPQPGQLVRGVLDDGLVLLDPAAILARTLAGRA